MKIFILYGCFLICFYQMLAQYTQVPDPNFEQALIDLGIDSEGILDGQFLTADALGVETLIIDELNISDVTGIEAFVDLLWLNLYGNSLLSIDLSLVSPTVYFLSLGNNQLSSVNLSPLPNLVNLFLGSNNISEIDLSNMSSLNVFGASSSPNLSSVVFDGCDSLIIINLTDNPLLTSLDLTDCTSLIDLDCYDSAIVNLDFSNNLSIEAIRCYNNPLTTISLPNNPNLELLWVDNTQLIELDVTNCPGLIDLQCNFIGLTELNLSGNPNLETIGASFNQLTTINISQNINLKNLYFTDNFVTGNLDLSDNALLENINCKNNPLTGINTINSPNLETISCYETQLISVDLSQNSNLIFADFFQCPNLEFVNIKNGTNESTLINFTGTQCPNLSCVVVDDPNADNFNILIDEGVTTLVGSVAECDDLSIKDFLIENVKIYPNPVNEILSFDTGIYEISELAIFDMMGRKVNVLAVYYHNQVDVTKLTSGVYFLELYIGNISIIKKFIKK